MKDFFCEDFFGLPVFSGFLRIFAVFYFLSQFFFEKDKFFIFIFCKKIISFLYFFLLFFDFSAKFSTKKIVPILEISQGQCPRKDFRIFADYSGFFRILISCPNFFLKKINFLFLFFVKNLFIFYIFFLFLGFSANFSTKKLSQFWKFPKVNVPEPAFSYY